MQKELLALVEGCTVSTRHGNVKTDHMLFVGSGAFSKSKPADLLPELQGRLPIRVQLSALTADQFVQILTDTRHSLCDQMVALLGTEGVKATFTACGVAEIARFSAEVNTSGGADIGARRLHTVVSKVLEALSFNASGLVRAAGGEEVEMAIDEAYVKEQLQGVAKQQDLAKYIL